MDHRLYHVNTQSSNERQQNNDPLQMDRRRSTWHPSQPTNIKRQIGNDEKTSPQVGGNVINKEVYIEESSQLSPQSMIYNEDFSYKKPEIPHKANQQSIINPSTRQSLSNYSPQQSSNNPLAQQSMAIKSLQPSITNEPNFNDQDVRSESTSDRFIRQPISDQFTQQFSGGRSTRQSTIRSHRKSMINDESQQSLSPPKSVRQSIATPSIRQSLANQSIRQSMTNKSPRPSTIVDSLNGEDKSFESQSLPTLEDENSTMQSTYKLDRQSMASRLARQSTSPEDVAFKVQYLDGKSLTIDGQYDDEGETLIYSTPYQSTINSNTRPSMSTRSRRQSRINQSTISPSAKQSSNAQIDQQSTTENFDISDLEMDNQIRPRVYRSVHKSILHQPTVEEQSSYKSLQLSMSNPLKQQHVVDRHLRQSMANPSTRQLMDPQVQHSTINNLEQDPQVLDGEGLLYTSPYRLVHSSANTPSTRQSIIEQPTRQSMGNRSIRPLSSSPSNRQPLTNQSIRQSIAKGFNFGSQTSTNMTLDVPTEMWKEKIQQQQSPYRSTRQSATNQSTHQPISDRSNRQSTANRSTCPSIVYDYDVEDQIFEDESQFFQPTYRSIQPSMINKSRPSTIGGHISYVKALEVEIDDAPYKSAQHSMANKSTPQSRSNSPNIEVEVFKDQGLKTTIPYASMRASMVNKSNQPSMVNRSTQESTMNVHGVDRQSLEDETYSNKSTYPSIRSSITNQSNQQLMANPSIRQSTKNQSIKQHIAPDTIKQYFVDENEVEPPMFNNEDHSSISPYRSIQQSMANKSGQQYAIKESIRQSRVETPNIEFQEFEDENITSQLPYKSTRKSTTNQSTRWANELSQQSMENKSIRQFAIEDPNYTRIYVSDEKEFVDQLPYRSNQQSQKNNSIRQSLENISTQQLTNDDQFFIKDPRLVNEDLSIQSPNRLNQQSLINGFDQEFALGDPTIEVRILEDEIQQSQSPYGLTRQSINDNLSQQFIEGAFIQHSTMNDHNVDLQVLEDEYLPNQSQYASNQQSIENKSMQQSIGEKSPSHSVDFTLVQQSTLQGPKLETQNFEEIFLIQEPPLKSSQQSMGVKSARQSLRKSQSTPISRKSSFDEVNQNQFHENVFSRLSSYSDTSNQDSTQNMETSTTIPIPSKFVTLEVRSNVQKESLDKFLVGGWDSVTLKIPPEMHSLLHGIRNSLSSDNPNLDLNHYLANETNDTQCTANIHLLYSGLQNSNKKSRVGSVYEPSQISQSHSKGDSSNCLNCNSQQEQSSVRFNIEGSNG